MGGDASSPVPEGRGRGWHRAAQIQPEPARRVVRGLLLAFLPRGRRDGRATVMLRTCDGGLSMPVSSRAVTRQNPGALRDLHGRRVALDDRVVRLLGEVRVRRHLQPVLRRRGAPGETPPRRTRARRPRGAGAWAGPRAASAFDGLNPFATSTTKPALTKTFPCPRRTPTRRGPHLRPVQAVDGDDGAPLPGQRQLAPRRRDGERRLLGPRRRDPR